MKSRKDVLPHQSDVALEHLREFVGEVVNLQLSPEKDDENSICRRCDTL